MHQATIASRSQNDDVNGEIKEPKKDTYLQ